MGTANPYRKVRSGEPIAIHAKVWNDLLPVARAQASGKLDFLTESAPTPRQMLVRNDSGSGVPRFGVLGIGGPLLNPANNAPGFLQQPAITGEAITANNAHKFVMTLEPIANGAIGACVLDGLVTGKVDVTDAEHEHARVMIGGSSLVSCVCGPVRIVARETGLGKAKHAILDMKHAPNAMFVQITGNSETGDNKWSYDWAEIDMNNGSPSARVGGMTSADYGLAYNLNELGNSDTGVQGNGIDLANVPIGFAIKPIGDGACAMLMGPYKRANGSPHWYFSAVNAVDGVC